MSEMATDAVPVRAWIEYVVWSVFARLTDGNWDFVVTPKGSEGEAAAGTTMSFETAVKGRYIESPLRSLRVLLSTGHELWCDVAGSNFTHWWLCRDHGSFVAWDYGRGSDAHYLTTGLIDAANLSDSAVVERALADAIAWVAAAPDQEGR